MLIWLASYPRSGNHLLRMILQRSFDIPSYEIYQQRALPMDPREAAIVGMRRFEDESPEAFLRRARSSPDLFLVKTHDPVPDTDMCIYIVRDARAALVSYRNFLADVSREPATIPELIAGTVWPGSWQDHVRRFLARHESNTSVLRYEEVASGLPPLDQIARFVGRPALRPFDVAFSDLKALDARRYATGNNKAGIEIVERDHHALFWENCGPLMEALGYAGTASHGGTRDGKSIGVLRAGSPPPRQTTTFNIVTPALNSSRHVEETIASVVGQAGDFSIRYHIQDGGSSDRTAEIAHRWQELIRSGETPVFCRDVEVTVDSHPDTGMYDAIAEGFRKLAPAADHFMTWINADDILAPGALENVAHAFLDLEDVDFLGGRGFLIDAEGTRLSANPTRTYARACIAAGLHDGRHLPFLMQEGTFWRGRLWNSVGGVDSSFKLAGDWDLWRRFASEAEFVALDAILASHRRHPGQLSEDKTPYYAEVDRRVADLRLPTDSVLSEFIARTQAKVPHPADRFAARLARRTESGRWSALRVTPPLPPGRRMLCQDGDWLVRSGFDQMEGPFPDLGINTPFHWMTTEPAFVEVFSDREGERTLCLEVRSMKAYQAVTLGLAGGSVVRRRFRGGIKRPVTISVTGHFDVGPNQLQLRVAGWSKMRDGRTLGILLSHARFADGPRGWWDRFGRRAAPPQPSASERS